MLQARVGVMGFLGMLAVIAIVASCASLDDAPMQPELGQTLAEASYVGQAVCVACHQQESSHWSHTVHAFAFQAPGASPVAQRGCEACHGPGSLHLTALTDRSRIVAFTQESAATAGQQNSKCLQCHSGAERIFWPGSPHETRDLSCSDCHNPMSRLSQTGLAA